MVAFCSSRALLTGLNYFSNTRSACTRDTAALLAVSQWSVPQRHLTSRVSLPRQIREIRANSTADKQQWNMSISVDSELSIKVAVLVSGSGRSLENICERIKTGHLRGCQVSIVLASKKTAGAIQRAERFGIPTSVLRLRDFHGNTDLYSDAISQLLDEFEVDLVVLAGWMHFYLIPSRYEGKVINIHPSLIPAFCGKGYYGHRVHEAVLDFGAKVTGCTVHLADNKYDHGPIILQKPVVVKDTDTADELATRVFECEKEALPEAIQLFVDKRLLVDGRLVRILPERLSSEV